jgi:hypothetical protein
MVEILVSSIFVKVVYKAMRTLVYFMASSQAPSRDTVPFNVSHCKTFRAVAGTCWHKMPT